MKRKSSHNPKSQSQKQAYNRYIQKTDYEPTVNDALKFSNSTQPGEELAEPTSKRKRKLNTPERLKDHFEENWLNWLVGGVAVVLIWLMVDSKIDLTRIGVILDYQKSDLSDVQQAAHDNEKKNVVQDLLINEHKVRIETLENRNFSSNPRRQFPSE